MLIANGLDEAICFDMRGAEAIAEAAATATATAFSYVDTATYLNSLFKSGGDFTVCALPLLILAQFSG